APAPQLVCPATAVEDVVAGTALEEVGGRVAQQQVVTRTPNGVFDGHAFSDRHVTGHPAHVRERTGGQVDLLVLAETREVQRVIAAAIPHRKNQLVGGRSGAVVVAASRGVEPINGVTGAGFHVRAI